MLKIFKQVFSPKDIAALRELIPQIEFEPGVKTARGAAAAVKNNLQAKEGKPLQNLRTLVSNQVMAHPAIQEWAMPRKMTPPILSRYTEGMAYGVHMDAPVMGSGAATVRCDLSCTVWLADPKSYTGGELVVDLPGGRYAVKGDVGDVVLYSSGRLHEVPKVTQGERMVSVFWIQSHVPNMEKRELMADLAELDRLLADKANGSPAHLLAKKVRTNMIRQMIDAP